MLQGKQKTNVQIMQVFEIKTINYKYICINRIGTSQDTFKKGYVMFQNK